MNCYAVKSIGYVISTISVALLGLVAWEAADEGWMRPLVIAGVLASIVGMALRWLTYREDKRQRGELGSVHEGRIGDRAHRVVEHVGPAL